MEIEQHVDTRTLDCANVLQHRGRLGVVQLRIHVDVDAPQTLGHRPAEQRPRTPPNAPRTMSLQSGPGIDSHRGSRTTTRGTRELRITLRS